MSKWSLLKSAVLNVRDVESTSSIHRFKGFQIIDKKKAFFPRFVFDYHIDEGVVESACLFQHFMRECEDFMAHIDICECFVQISTTTENEGSLREALKQGEEIGLIRIEDSIQFKKENEDCRLEKRPIMTAYVLSRKRSSACSPIDYWIYRLSWQCAEGSDTLSKIVQVRTRERRQNSRIGRAGILSNVLHGVDNTGNVCVWPAENVLLCSILRNPVLLETVSGKTILEIGGGMTGLCGLGLGASGYCKTIVITDGHPDCVSNQRACIQMCKQSELISEETQLSAEKLCWSLGDENGDVARVTANYSKDFDVIVASDCLFFRDFHDALLDVLLLCLSPKGVVLMLQPPRAGSMQLFLEKAANKFDISIEDNYCTEVTTLRTQYQASFSAPEYDEDIHYPVLVTLRRKE